MNIRHGDLGLIGINKLPEGLTASDSKIIMRGSGGNDHTFEMKELSDFKIIDEINDGYGYPMRIISFTLEGYKKPFLFLNCYCPSTGREYLLQTKQKTALSAKAKSFGFYEVKFDKEY